MGNLLNTREGRKKMSKLPLKLRKNIRDTEEKFKENAAKIADAMGGAQEITLDVDWEATAESATASGYEHRAGEVLHDWIIGGLASNIVSLCKDETAREALVNTWTTGVIIHRTGDPKSGYHSVTFEDGNLVIESKTKSLGSNVGQCGQSIQDQLQSPGGNDLTLKAQQNVEKTSDAREKTLEAIKDAVELPVDVTLDMDWAEFEDGCKASGYTDRPGDIIGWQLDALKSNFARAGKDEMVREAVQEEWTTGVIQHRAEDCKYHDIEFEDGNLILISKPGSFGTNVDKCGANLEDKL